MAERIDLQTPYQPDPRQATSFTVWRLDLNWRDAVVGIYLKDDSTGVIRTFSYTGQEATNLMVALNKMNLTIKSLHRRVIEKLINDELLSGTIEGTPD